MNARRTYSKLSDELAVKRALGNFIGAADTTRFALFTVLSCIALSTRVQARIREEQKQVNEQGSGQWVVGLANQELHT